MTDITGIYSDPLHGHCVRSVVRVRGHPNRYTIYGVYGDDEAPYKPGEPWTASVYCTGKFLTVEFTGKALKQGVVLSALWCPSVREIHWEDGNVWKKLYSTV